MGLPKTMEEPPRRALCSGFIHGCFSQKNVTNGACSVALVHSMYLDKVINLDEISQND